MNMTQMIPMEIRLIEILKVMIESYDGDKFDKFDRDRFARNNVQKKSFERKSCKEKGLVNLVKVVGGSQFDRHESHGGRSDRYEVARNKFERHHMLAEVT